MELKTEERDYLHGALDSAIPFKEDLEKFALLKFGVPLDKIAGEGDTSYRIMMMIVWFEKQGRINELIQKAISTFPLNQKISESLPGILDSLEQRRKEVAQSGLHRLPTLEKSSSEEILKRIEEEVVKRLEKILEHKLEGLRTGGDTESKQVPASVPQLPDSKNAEKKEELIVLEAGKKAISKLGKMGEDASLTPDEAVGLEAIILLTGRPALLIKDGVFIDTPSAWSILDQPKTRSAIETTIKSVGRIEVENHPLGYRWLGTGFLVADDVVMTSRSVASGIAQKRNGKWVIPSKIKVWINYHEQLEEQAKARFKINGIIGIHELADMALLRVSKEGTSGAQHPAPLPLSAAPQLDGERKVYIVGYPAYDARKDPGMIRRIFSDVFDVKRLQPGEIVGLDSGGTILKHDCSTLGGNAGSCVVDLETNQVIGLHFAAERLGAGFAVVLSKLRNDPLMKKGKLEFV